ncbi:hypothetical protein A1O1_03138 [Capronia coronata CBS 617.96]|uniref:WSC domain-containing protein n=1 Tax=Capronia coronata CBS 617.96 TaxID=1182541 RepID=W9YZL5_9EURO|nr:uncharacterized protein A1O1_03138 [Capronia coronata CBS 617.96]EXJ94741.1 hypothetical protein A1O1_03138 [Capronia coronata CBS 617.96]
MALFSTTAMGQTATANAPSSITTLGCYQHPNPLVEQGSYTFQTSGYCQTQCVGLNKAVMAITGGSTCYCGDELPSLDQEVDQGKCDSACQGYDQQTCGGLGYWQVYLTGLNADVDTAPNSTTIASTAQPTSTQGSDQPPTSTQPSVITKAGQTIVVTASADATATAVAAKSSGGPNKVGIAVGVVVGVIALAAIIGVVLFYMKRRKNREIEEEHRRNAAVGAFGSSKSDKASTTDQRLDPSIYSHRRPSIGSIADERDFSRRILQVRNPDRDSKASNFA